MSANHPEVSVHLLRLYHLRDHVWPLAEARERAGRLDFGQFRSECGTYVCLLGEAAMTPQLQADGWRWGGCVLHTPIRGEQFGISAAAIYYGLTHFDIERLFGLPCHGTLADRHRVLDRIIAEKEAALAASQPEGAGR